MLNEIVMENRPNETVEAGMIRATLVNFLKSLAAGALVLLCATAFAATNASSTPAWPKADPAAIAHWQSLRFGMFIHWGPVSLTGKEIGWSRGAQTPMEIYDNLYKEFNPTNFNADEWVSIARAAGMKYIVLTTKATATQRLGHRPEAGKSGVLSPTPRESLAVGEQDFEGNSRPEFFHPRVRD